jgi:hypothetical protein
VAELSQSEYIQVLAIASFVRKSGIRRVVMEDFALDPGGAPGGKEGVSPIRITYGVLSAVMQGDSNVYVNGGAWRGAGRQVVGGLEIDFQMPSLAKSTITDERLRKRGGWVPGMQHARDAVRHVFTATKASGIQRVK